MARSISQIYSEAVATRNDYLQISNLNSKRSESKLSVINILTYVMSALIYSYEVLLDAFQVQVAQLIANRVSGTPAYYVKMAEYFQYNSDTQAMDEMTYDDSTFQAKFVTLDETHRIIAKAAYVNSGETGIILKVCKSNTDSTTENGGLYSPLSSDELTAFKNYMDEIKFVGAKIYCNSIYGDILSIKATITYDDLYIDETQALKNVKSAIISYIEGVDFNGYIYYQSVIDAIQSAEHIVMVNSDASVTLREYDSTAGEYKDTATTVVGRCLPASGYLTCVDLEGDSTLVADSEHFTFAKNSETN